MTEDVIRYIEYLKFTDPVGNHDIIRFLKHDGQLNIFVFHLNSATNYDEQSNC